MDAEFTDWQLIGMTILDNSMLFLSFFLSTGGVLYIVRRPYSSWGGSSEFVTGTAHPLQ